ncbi:MAG: dienelactone hydrolase family protein [Planctomycetes bacterium]|nr:dienelactone hydrolase family protein [Planctomycetota bacterium]
MTKPASLIQVVVLALCFAANVSAEELTSTVVSFELDTTYDGADRKANVKVLEFDVPEGTKLPMMISLHGAFLNERIEFGYFEEVCKAKNIILCCPKSRAIAWTPKDHQMLDDLYEYMVANYPVDTDRVYLSGLSSGGNCTFDYGIQRADRFAAAIPFAGYLTPSVAEAEFAREGHTTIPFYIVHGDADFIVNVQSGRDANRILTDAGYEVVYEEIPNLNHAVPIYRLPDILDWALEHSLSGNADTNSGGEAEESDEEDF